MDNDEPMAGAPSRYTQVGARSHATTAGPSGKTTWVRVAAFVLLATLLGVGVWLIVRATHKSGDDNTPSDTDEVDVTIGDVQVHLASSSSGSFVIVLADANVDFTVHHSPMTSHSGRVRALVSRVQQGNAIGLEGQFGKLMVDKTTGVFTLSDSNNTVLATTLHAPSRNPNGVWTLAFNRTAGAQLSGSGCGDNDATTLSHTFSNATVQNTLFNTPHYHSSEGYSVLAETSLQFSSSCMYCYPVVWNATNDKVVWTVEGSYVSFHIAPAPSHAASVNALWELTGRPVVPPKYAFGFIACRWGWTDLQYIENMLDQFRNGSFPLDSWISDFEWYTAEPDYSLPETGSPTFRDFEYNNATFPNPQANLDRYHSHYHLRFGGIRKPRLGNSDLLTMANEKGWTVKASHGGGAPGGTRNLNYSREDVREWYNENSAHFLSDGVDYWWNDEGETFYFAFHWWNTAQKDMLEAFDAKRRFFSINRSYTPGMQRLGATQWTGDVAVSWESLSHQPGYVLNWGLAGSAYVTSDTGGFRDGHPSPLLLTRWYQVSAFIPIMRVHSRDDDTPHFPFLYGPEAADAMRKALNLRYQLIPYHYSLAHAAYEVGGRPIFRPMAMAFESNPAVAEMTSQWMDGDSILVCPVLSADNSTQCYLPALDNNLPWFEFNATATHNAGTVTLTNVPLDHVPLFVRSGAIVVLAAVTQHVGQLPGGPLQVHIYDGKDALFVLVEDDGETLDYQTGHTRRVALGWDNAKKTLSWVVVNRYTDEHSFTSMVPTLFSSQGTMTRLPAQDITTTGSVVFE